MDKKTKKERLTKWKIRPFSWSQLSSFEYDPEQWYKGYFLGERNPETKEMVFGKNLADDLEHGRCKIKELIDLLPFHKEYPFKVSYGKIVLVGFCDDFDDKTFKNLNEVKTGRKEWTQRRADDHGQFTMYLLMNYITHKIQPEEVECWLHWLPTMEDGDFSIQFVKPIKVVSFKTKRTMSQVLEFGGRINRTIKEMEEFAKNHA